VQGLARDWGAAAETIDAAGITNGDLGHGDLPDQRILLQRLQRLGR
jgi:predicted alpha/beta hydrolase family esterase